MTNPNPGKYTYSIPSAPDPLGRDMRWAAPILRRASKRFNLPENSSWTPDELDSESETVDTEDKEIEAMRLDLLALRCETSGSVHTDTANLAKQLIARGWRKE